VTNLCTTAGTVFVRDATGWTSDANHLGGCATSTICSLYNYGTNRGFQTKESGESSCIKCIEDAKAIKSSTSGSCGLMTSLCSNSGEVFIRVASGWSGNTNHLGDCETSSICEKFEYGTGHGFDTKSNGELACLKCLENGHAILSATSGTCDLMTTLCSTSGSVFVRYATGWTGDVNHLGSCDTSTICATFDYGTDHGF
jgi:hypothetical protein